MDTRVTFLVQSLLHKFVTTLASSNRLENRRRETRDKRYILHTQHRNIVRTCVHIPIYQLRHVVSIRPPLPSDALHYGFYTIGIEMTRCHIKFPIGDNKFEQCGLPYRRNPRLHTQSTEDEKRRKCNDLRKDHRPSRHNTNQAKSLH